MFSLEARRAGRIAASIPARIATPTKTTSVPYGTANTIPYWESAAVVSTARNMPTAIPSAAPISAVTMLSCRIIRRTCRRVMPIARSIPSSRVRSKTESTSVLMTPNRLTITERPSSAYRICSDCVISPVRVSLNSSRVSTTAAGNAARLFSSAAVFAADGPPSMFRSVSSLSWSANALSKVAVETETSPNGEPPLGGSTIPSTWSRSVLPVGVLTVSGEPTRQRVVVGVPLDDERAVPAELGRDAASEPLAHVMSIDLRQRSRRRR